MANSYREKLENLNIEESISRLDRLLETRAPSAIDRMGFCLGIRLALEMALEIRDGKSLGSETGSLIAGWVRKYGEAQAEIAVETARMLLNNPGKIKEELEKRLFGGGIAG